MSQALALRGDQEWWSARTRRDEATGCLLWTKALCYGYGHLVIAKRTLKAHRLSYEQFVGLIPEGYEVDHLCRVRACVEPTHLEAVTKQENLRRQAEANFRPHCPQGHELTTENLRRIGRGDRQCRLCHNERQRAYAARKRGAAA